MTLLPKRSAAFAVAVLILLFIGALIPARADDGYRLWLRYDKLPNNAVLRYRKQILSMYVAGDSATSSAVRGELASGIAGSLGERIAIGRDAFVSGELIVGTPASSKVVGSLHLERELSELGDEGFIIRTFRTGNRSVTVIASTSDRGLLYGAFHFLRLIQTLRPIDKLNVAERPRIKLRLLDHWDNADGSVERGYAGRSLWKWGELPARIDPRYRDYARANASVGINGSVLNNVNADAVFLTTDYLQKVAAIADVLRPYGIKVYLSARFSAPIELGGLKTADPLDPKVAAWWKRKADEIHELIPDFGGFLVKANSEGQPGPRTYGRDHVDGANMLAAALAPHGGVVIWRAFVYDAKPGYDRAGAAYENLQPFDGKFASNVILQVKNGPIDFQPREPFHPLFGSMPKTQVAPEFQITQEYMGFSNHLVFLANMWHEVLESDTYARGLGSSVAKIADGELFGQKITAIAGVANTGSDRNWTGYDMLQANWYAFGRLAWDPDATPEAIADEWTKMTLSHDPNAIVVITRMLLGSHEAVVNYMTPLGLHHQMWGGHHYGPAPWWNSYDRDDWNPTYYNKADAGGIGFDRTMTGSNTVSQYFPSVRDQYSSLATCPDTLLLWFHHVKWDYRMRTGRTLWAELALHYQEGVYWVRNARRQWAGLKGTIDPQRYAAVARKLAIQERDAVWWKDASLSYFQSLSKMSLPKGVEPPKLSLEQYKTTDLLDDFARGKGNFDENHKD